MSEFSVGWVLGQKIELVNSAKPAWYLDSVEEVTALRDALQEFLDAPPMAVEQVEANASAHA